jgi:hypothetical protein
VSGTPDERATTWTWSVQALRDAKVEAQRCDGEDRGPDYTADAVATVLARHAARPGLSGPDEFPAGGAENSCCADCRQPYTVWSADNDLWNAVMRPNGEQEDEPFLCARCFLIRAQPVTEFADVVWPKYPSRRDRAAAVAES